MHTVKGAPVLDTESEQKPLSKHSALRRLLRELNNHFWWVSCQINTTNTQWAPTVCPALCNSLEYKDKWVRGHRLLGGIDAFKKKKIEDNTGVVVEVGTQMGAVTSARGVPLFLGAADGE